MPRLLPIVLTTLLALGCRDASGLATTRVEVSTDRASYAVRDRIIVTTRNVGTSAAYDDHCGGSVSQLDADPTNRTGGMARACGLVPSGSGSTNGYRFETSFRIEPGAAHVDTFHVSAASPRGTWVVTLALRDADMRILPESQRRSAPFAVVVP